jgi:hypothetical protein
VQAYRRGRFFLLPKWIKSQIVIPTNPSLSGPLLSYDGSMRTNSGVFAEDVWRREVSAPWPGPAWLHRAIASPRISIKAVMHTKAPFAASEYTPISVSIIAVLVVAVYANMFGNYRVNLAVDTPWYLSISYNYCIKGIDTDATFGGSFPFAMGGTVAFGKIAAMVQCAALAPFNWSLVAANVLSVAGIVLSMAAIFAFLVAEGFRRFEAVTCCLALAATEPFVAMANQSKYEYITFLLAVCGLLLAARRHLVLAGLISVLAIEVQPIGIMAPIYLIAYELSRMFQTPRVRIEFDRVAKLVCGGALGLAVYFILHPNILALLAASSNSPGWNAYRSHFLYGYFFQARLYRHLPELGGICCLPPGSHLATGLHAMALPSHRLTRDAFRRIFAPPREWLLHTLLVFPFFPSGVPNDKRLMARCCGSRACTRPVRSAIRGRVRGGTQIRGTGRTGGGTIGHCQPRHRLEPGPYLRRLHILARVQGPLVRVDPFGLVRPGTHPARHELSDLWSRSAVLHLPPTSAPRPRMREASTTSNCSEAIIDAIAVTSLGVYW